MWIGFFVALLTGLLLTPLARKVATALGVLDHPDGWRKLQRRPVPLWGGVAVYAALVAGVLTAQQAAEVPPGFAQLALALVFSAGLVCLLGCVDDLWNLPGRFKLLLQIGSVLPIALSGFVVRQVVVFGVPVELGWLGLPLTLLWLIGCINALNLLDGLDGLATTVGLSTAGMMVVIASSMGHEHVAWCALVLAGALAGFLVYNLPPARIYLGDSGSMVIGLACGVLAIQGAMKTATTLSITAPALVLAVPMLDTALAVLRRRLSGQSIYTPDRGHIHHRLLERGLSTWQALCVVGALCLVTGALATAATLFRKDALAWIAVVCLFVLLVRWRVFGHYELDLLKHALRRWVQRYARLPSKDSAEPLSFQRSLVHLARELARWNVLRVEACWSTADHQRWTQECENQLSEHPDASHWELRISHQTDGGELAVRVVLATQGSNTSWNLLQVAQRVESFAAFWSQHLPRIVPQPTTSQQLISPSTQARAA